MRRRLSSSLNPIAVFVIVAASVVFVWTGLKHARASAANDGESMQTNQGGYDPSLFASLRWRNIGPNRGGRSIASSGVAKRPLEYYLGAVGGGLWKTGDGGTTWNPGTDGQLHNSSVGGG